MFFIEDPKFRARQCRERADVVDDPKTAAFLRKLADEYDAMARAEPSRTGQPIDGANH